jgi:hypothetical protein
MRSVLRVADNITIICVRAGVTPPQIINSTKIKNMQEDSKKHNTPTDANNVVCAGWQTLKECQPKKGELVTLKFRDNTYRTWVWAIDNDPEHTVFWYGDTRWVGLPTCLGAVMPSLFIGDVIRDIEDVDCYYEGVVVSINPIRYKITKILWCNELDNSMVGEISELKWWYSQPSA